MYGKCYATSKKNKEKLNVNSYKYNKKLNILLAGDINPTRPWYRDRVPSIIDAFNKVEYSCELIDY